MTEKLFYENAYLKEAKAKVTRMEGNKVYLDKTIFFGFSGGQQSDSGSINGIPLKDVIKEGKDIAHEFDVVPNFSVGQEVELKLDWEKRYRLMKLHSAAHVAYYFFAEKTGIRKLIGSNVSMEKARFDFESEKPVTELLPEIEEKSNAFIRENHEITRTHDVNERGDFYWWNCAQMKMPCGGLHVKNTSEIGLITLKRKNIGKGKERIEIYLKD